MKKLILCFCGFMLLFFVSCKNIPIQDNPPDLENQVAYELMMRDKNYSDETLKAMSVIIRTNLSINSPTKSNFGASEKYLNLTNQTKGQVLKNNQNNMVEISFENSDNYNWQKTIKKSEILKYALKNNISLTTLSKINPDIKDGVVMGLEIGNKYFNYEELAKEFNLESNIIENITQNKNEIIINGKNKGFNGYFNIEKSEQLSNNNYFYQDILGDFFENLTLIKN